MNSIKYINPRTGVEKRVRIIQTPWWKIADKNKPRHGNMRQVDERMQNAGFVRAGLRRRGKAARDALRINRLKAALTDNAALAL